jgi:methionyl-tRNA formyltransferase
MTRAVVFAYHDVGVRCLKVLLAQGVDVGLVVTHADNPSEQIWFDSVASTAAAYGLPVITPADANDEATFAAVAACRPRLLFSFYFRQMLAPRLLELAAGGAYNLHGSLLPRYRGRVPVNWAVLHGETQTGATLHVMQAKPDRGAIVAQQAVPILPDDTAGEVFAKVVVAAEIALHGCLPALLAAPRRCASRTNPSQLFRWTRPRSRRSTGRTAPGRSTTWCVPRPALPGCVLRPRRHRLRLLRTLRCRPGPGRARGFGCGLFNTKAICSHGPATALCCACWPPTWTASR